MEVRGAPSHTQRLALVRKLASDALGRGCVHGVEWCPHIIPPGRLRRAAAMVGAEGGIFKVIDAAMFRPS